jgi:hypothetical protein
MSTELFRRAWTVTVDTLDVSALDVEFKILKSLKPEPNKCVLTIWNLNEDHRAQLLKRNQPNPGAKLVGIKAQIEAGYKDNTSVLFSGDLREVASSREGTDWKTTLSGDDGGRSYREGKIDKQFAKGTSIGDVLKACANAMGIGLGNVSDYQATAQIEGIGSTLPHTMALSGNASQQLDRVVKSMGLTWSIQNGALQLLNKGKPLNQSAIKLSPDTGLLDSPQSAIDSTVSLGNPQQFAPGAKQTVAKPPKPKAPGILKLKSLLIPGMVPGRKIDLQSAQFNGGYYLTECEYVGQSWSTDWFVNSVARIY